ncbi:hypothetical protein CKO14_04655 [Halorhodospira halophila]|nr:hypothetical protein [Halorhodospira halophila]
MRVGVEEAVGPHLGVDRVDPGGGQAYPHLSGARLRGGYLGGLQYVRVANGGHLDAAHGPIRFLNP